MLDAEFFGEAGPQRHSGILPKMTANWQPILSDRGRLLGDKTDIPLSVRFLLRFDPTATSAAVFCCDAGRCPLVGFVLDEHFRTKWRNFVVLIGTGHQLGAHHLGCANVARGNWHEAWRSRARRVARDGLALLQSAASDLRRCSDFAQGRVHGTLSLTGSAEALAKSTGRRRP